MTAKHTPATPLPVGRHKSRLVHMTDEKLQTLQVSLGMALDQAIDQGRKRDAGNVRKRLWRVMDERDRRKGRALHSPRSQP